MGKRLFLVCALMLVQVPSALAQGTIDKDGVYRPTEEQLANNKRLAELLRHPTFITLRLVSIPHDIPREKPTDTPGPYKVKERIDFKVLITQNSFENIVIWNVMDPYYEYRPELTRDGDILPHTKQAQEKADRAEKQPASGSSAPNTLVPGREYEWTRVSLEDWYEPLGPGHYQLTVRKRFAWDGDWVQSNPVIFDVQPRNPAPIPATVKIEMLPQDFQDQPRRELYRLRNDVYVTVFVVNDSGQRIKIEVVDTYFANRPQLFRNGVLVPYREDAAKLVRSEDEDPRTVGLSSNLFVEAHNRSGLEGLSLTTWYGPLEPGQYRLINRRRFEIEGPWTADSAPLVFEVLPSKMR